MLHLPPPLGPSLHRPHPPWPLTGLAKQLALPQTASLALCGPLQVLDGEDGRCWFPAFDSQGELLQVRPRRLLAGGGMLQVQMTACSVQSA